MPTVSFIGLGLNDDRGLTIEGLEETKRCKAIFAEFYTNLMPHLNLQRLESMIGKKIQVLNRTQLEDDGGRDMIWAAREGDVALLVPGDPMIATTHISLRLSLSRIGIKSRIIHSASIMSAVCGATGLQSYKFGKAITIPYDGPLPKSVLDTISDNSARGLHTLLLLDINASQGRQLTITEALTKMMRTNPDMENLLAVGAARIGDVDEKVKAGRIRTLITEDFGDPPHSIVAVGKLHFMESEALKVLCGARDEDLKGFS
jgi:diphthine synthase